MGLSASQGRMLLLTARQTDLEYRAQQISQKRLVLSQQLEEIAVAYEDATSNRQMKIALFLNDDSTGNDMVNRSSNLTYATLVSGTLAQFSPSQSGIQAYSKTIDQMYSSTSAYRLVSADGLIVVSSKDEIPVKTNENTKPDNNTDNNTNIKPDTNDKNPDNGSNMDSDIGFDSITNPDIDSTFENKNNDSTIQNEPSQNVENNNIEQSLTLKEIKDGRYDVVDKDGKVVASYLVDEGLRYGSTQVNGATDGPNYLQDCLRNGKYLIEKGTYSKEDQDVKWSSMSWDGTANISDGYYLEDDDRAKAKYDRLQTQIQIQDKKLELELDNIETQRKAVTTEQESVKKIMEENIKGSFNIFG